MQIWSIWSLQSGTSTSSTHDAWKIRRSKQSTRCYCRLFAWLHSPPLWLLPNHALEDASVLAHSQFKGCVAPCSYRSTVWKCVKVIVSCQTIRVCIYIYIHIYYVYIYIYYAIQKKIHPQIDGVVWEQLGIGHIHLASSQSESLPISANLSVCSQKEQPISTCRLWQTAAVVAPWSVSVQLCQGPKAPGNALKPPPGSIQSWEKSQSTDPLQYSSRLPEIHRDTILLRKAHLGEGFRWFRFCFSFAFQFGVLLGARTAINDSFEMFRRKNHAQHHLSGSVSFPERCGARTNACSAE